MPLLTITDQELHRLARRAARRCRHIIQAVLREDEWGLADECFSSEIFQVFREIRTPDAEIGSAQNESQKA